MSLVLFCADANFLGRPCFRLSLALALPGGPKASQQQTLRQSKSELGGGAIPSKGWPGKVQEAQEELKWLGSSPLVILGSLVPPGLPSGPILEQP